MHEYWVDILYLINRGYGDILFTEEYDTYQYRVYNFELGKRKLKNNIYLPFKAVYKLKGREIHSHIVVINKT